MSASVGGRQLASTNVTAFAGASLAVTGGVALLDPLQATATAIASQGDARHGSAPMGTAHGERFRVCI